MKKVNVAVVGATGMVGRKILEILEEREFPVEKLYPFASERSAGKTVHFNGQDWTIEAIAEDAFDGKDIDIAFFAAGGSVSEKYAPIAVEKGIRVVDNSSYYRMANEVPLVVPEVNSDAIQEDNHLIANPNCSTIQSVVALKPLADKFGIERVVYTTYQAVSGSGVGGVADLESGEANFYPHSISNNVIPHIDTFEEDGYTKEEIKMVNETRKILGQDDIRITATAARVPVKNSHAVSINVELSRPFEMEEIYAALEGQAGLEIVDDVANNVYPLEENADETDQVYVGRIRRDHSVDNGINMWVVADNIRKGAATNTVQIAEEILKSL